VKRVVCIPGEDAAPEAFEPTVELVSRMKLGIEWLRPPVGEPAQRAHGSTFPPDARAAIDASDATFFGSTSGPSVPALFYLRWGKGTFANVRPVRWLPGCKSPLAHPEGLDLVIVRENLEDMYVGVEGELESLAPLGLVSRTLRGPVHELAPGRFALKMITRAGTERVARFSFELARKRRARGRPGELSVGTKHNMLPRSDGYFRDIVLELASDYPDVPVRSYIVDDLACRLVIEPQAHDVVLLPNLYGDILSDAAAGTAGGLGLAPSGCYGPSYAYFESAHGTAPDIAGRNVINPTATILSAALMLEYLGFEAPARALEQAVERTYAAGKVLTPDQGGTATTTQFCDGVARELGL
jgi:isocitrate/isopropylmalate dehydrogenase